MAKERLDLTGQRFGKLVVIEFGEMRKCHSYWLCKCDCGNSFVTQGTSLKTGNTKSCGCIKKERIIAISTSHGKRNTDTYKTWAEMLQRCNNIKNKHYKDYGKRGISVCDEWRTFEGFYKDMGDRPEGLTLDRKDNDSSYCKDNCQWSTQTEQANNRER